jgi:hypothetical protein
MSVMLSGLVAYPSDPPDIGQTINRGLNNLHKERKFLKLNGWEETDIPGRFIATEVLQRIQEGNIFFADVTKLNFNVVFEVGFAIGIGKRAIILRNEMFDVDTEFIRRVGIFDTLGYAPYRDATSLESIISNITDLAPLGFGHEDRSTTTPAYLVLPQMKGDIETHLVARIKKARVPFRSYDPEEHGRLSALAAIENVVKSHGIIILFLARHYKEADVHNMRGAFVAGLAQGMNRLLLLLQSGDDPVPLDYRDLVRRFKFPNQIDEYVAEFAASITESLVSVQPTIVRRPATFLSRLTLGASSAENEFQELGQYFLETDEFRRTLRGEVQIVLGRKGAGKTALFFQLRDRLREDNRSVVLDLKPEGFQLLKFKAQVLDYLEEGTQEHTITAFWEYLLLLEICHKLLEKDKALHFRDHRIYPLYRELASAYETDEYITEGDFAERMSKLTKRISEDFSAGRPNSAGKVRMTGEEITQLLYKHDIASLRSQLTSYLKYKQALWILFDNLDKGWPPHGVTTQDVLTLRCLIDAMDKLQRTLRREGIDTSGVVFVRNDVYENLVEATPDRGKMSRVLVDWSDPELLLEILRRRFVFSGIKETTAFQNIWRVICVSHVRGEESAHYMIDRCLMRPRSLIEFVRFCRAHAVNFGHRKVTIEDIEHAEEQYSTQLVNDICYEIQDVFPSAKDVLYEFIECPSELDDSTLRSRIAKVTTDSDMQDRILDFLLWYGVIGFRREDGEATFIYSVRYDMKRLKALLKKRAIDTLTYVINPAFWKGLEIKTVM